MLALAEVSAFKARNTSISLRSEKLCWFQVATLVYELLISKETDGIKSSLQSSLIMLSINMIEEFGKNSVHLFINKIFINNWFLNDIEFSIEEAILMSKEAYKFRSGQLSEIKNDSHKLTIFLGKLRVLIEIRQKLKILDKISQLTQINDKQVLLWLSVKNEIL